MSYTFRCPKKVVSYIVEHEYHDNFVAFPSNKQGEVYNIGEKGLIWQLQPNDLVVSRFNAPLMRLCVSLYLYNQPAKIRGKDELYEQLIGMMKPYFKAIANWPDKGYAYWLDDTNKLIASLKNDKLDSHAELLADKADCIRICYSELAGSCQSFVNFADAIKNLFSDTNGDGYVILSTIHKAKGDEAERVFVIGYSRLPYLRPNMQDWQCQQENNLVYVALSRAKSELYLIDSNLSRLEKSLIEDTEIGEIDYVDIEAIQL
jgi:ATP-dependent exoDNAse (exonuclease V) beta subunit